MKKVSNSLEDTKTIAVDFVKTLTEKDTKGAMIIGLSGDLGSAKTTFVKSVAEALGIKEIITSPTFIIEKIYKLDDHFHFDHLIHIDAYRMENGEELMTLGFDDLIQNPRNLILIEWPEKVNEVLPEDMKILKFTFIDEYVREIEI